MFELNKLYNMDCMEGMKQIPDKYFELAIVDPPYGGGSQSVNVERERGLQGGSADFEQRGRSRFGGWFDRYHISSKDGRQVGSDFGGDEDIRHWDIAPNEEYFNELARVSKNQIIWGGNYFDLPPTRCFLIWRKLSISENFSMAMCEYAWTSFNDNAKLFEYPPQGNKEQRFHPTQKPVELYKWVIGRFAKEGDKILDTHAGSGSCLIAAYETGHDWLGFELDKYYYEKATERIEARTAQMMFW